VAPESPPARWWIAVAIGLVVAGGAGAGCSLANGSESDRGGAPGEALGAALPLGGCPNRPPGSSPAIVDASSGTYAAHVVAFDSASLSLEFDVVQWLSGEDAIEVYRRDHPDDPQGMPPDDYVLVNESPQVRTAPLRRDATILLPPSLEVADASVSAATVDDLTSFVPTAGPAEEFGNIFWLTFGAGEVTDLCFQYRP
jgi:hypothetical protein